MYVKGNYGWKYDAQRNIYRRPNGTYLLLQDMVDKIGSFSADLFHEALGFSK